MFPTSIKSAAARRLQPKASDATKSAMPCRAPRSLSAKHSNQTMQAKGKCGVDASSNSLCIGANHQQASSSKHHRGVAVPNDDVACVVASDEGVAGNRNEDFIFKKEIGRGASGITFEVTSRVDGAVYVVKTVNLKASSTAPCCDWQGANNRETRQSSLREISLIRAVKSPYVVQLYSAWIQDDKANCVLEYAPSGTLHQYCRAYYKKGAHIPEKTIWQLFIQLAVGLRDMHAAGVVHRDFKASNILLGVGGQLKIADFGLAVSQSQSTAGAKLRGRVCGTYITMSPEICAERPYDEKVDIWALGCVMYFLCSFHSHPWEGIDKVKDPQQLLRVLRNKKPRSLPNHYSAELCEVINRCIALDPKERPSALEVLSHPEAIRWAQVHELPECGRAGLWRSVDDMKFSKLAEARPWRKAEMIPKPPSATNNASAKFKSAAQERPTSAPARGRSIQATVPSAILSELSPVNSPLKSDEIAAYNDIKAASQTSDVCPTSSAATAEPHSTSTCQLGQPISRVRPHSATSRVQSSADGSSKTVLMHSKIQVSCFSGANIAPSASSTKSAQTSSPPSGAENTKFATKPKKSEFPASLSGKGIEAVPKASTSCERPWRTAKQKKAAQSKQSTKPKKRKLRKKAVLPGGDPDKFFLRIEGFLRKILSTCPNGLKIGVLSARLTCLLDGKPISDYGVNLKKFLEARTSRFSIDDGSVVRIVIL